MADNDFFYNPLFGSAVTIGAYALSLQVHARFRFLHPLLLTSGAIIALLLAGGIPYDAYFEGGSIVSIFLGPATIALGVPLYKQRHVIRERLMGIVGSITSGCAASIAASWALVATAGGSQDVLLASLPKSASSAFAIEIAKAISGPQELTAVFTVLTGLIGSMAGLALLKLFRIDGSIPIGIAVGTSSHGIGTSRLIRDNEQAGAYSGLAMGIAGIATAVLMVPAYWLLQLLGG